MQDLPFQTLTQFSALGLTLIGGWFLGLASASGGRKWRERYYDEELSNVGYRDRAESDLRDAARRIRDLEAENAKLRAGAPAHDEGHSTAALAGAAVAGAAAGAAVTHAVHEHHDDHPVAAAPAEPAPVAHDDHGHADHGHDANVPAAHDSHGDHAPADAHHH
ncbi:MAG: hypothetical protein EOP61_01595 [Sphingomonadales bacterium]|nr:MAG: hypothetical protein EOP61_01595 [Sphingomonadales bacterium]